MHSFNCHAIQFVKTFFSNKNEKVQLPYFKCNNEHFHMQFWEREEINWLMEFNHDTVNHGHVN